jgi:hypothetical protein
MFVLENMSFTGIETVLFVMLNFNANKLLQQS